MSGFGLDAYTRNARLKPALLALAPAAWTLMAWSPDHAFGWGGIWTVIVGVGGTLLLSQLARDRGKRKERALHDSHGGRPSERLLSHVRAGNRITLSRRHAKLRRLIPDVRIPTEAEEARNPAAAHEVYHSCVEWLIARTRENRLLLEENINYGFRRNLWGLKPVGLIVSAASSILLGVHLWTATSAHSVVAPLAVALEVCNVVVLLLWLFVVGPRWVMVPSRAYAERLLEGLDQLPEQTGEST